MDEKYSNYTVKDISAPSSPIELFAKKVLDKLITEGIPPTPSNYTLYFFNMLEDEDEKFKKQIHDMISLEENNDVEKDIQFEKDMKISFKYSKEILQHTAVIYKITKQLKSITSEALKEFSHLSSPKMIEKYLNTVMTKIDKFSEKMEDEIKEIKELYSKNIEIMKEIDSNTLFDMTYGVYNAKYFKRVLTKEIKSVQKFKHTSSFITLKVSNDTLGNIKLKKSFMIINRSIAKILLKTSRRTDIIAHLGNGIFAMLLKHTDRIGAQKTVERLADIISNSTVFIEGNEAEIKIVAAICELKENKEYEDYMKMCSKNLQIAEKENKLYVIEGDE